MPNRRYLAWRLTSPKATAKLLVLGTSNLAPSKEDGKADYGRANAVDAYEKNAISLRRQPLAVACLISADRLKLSVCAGIQKGPGGLPGWRALRYLPAFTQDPQTHHLFYEPSEDLHFDIVVLAVA